MPRFVESSPDQHFLLPPDMREWIPEDDIVHFLLAAVERVSLSHFKVNARGSGSAQYHPRTMLALLIYCCINDIRSSRQIERATYRDIGARVLMGDTHPDHDTICSFRRQNKAAIEQAFFELLLLAKESGFLKVGVVSVDGTKIRANASKRRSIRYDRALELREEVREDVKEMLEQMEAADRADEPDGQKMPEKLRRGVNLIEVLDKAARRLERQERERARERAERKAPADGASQAAGEVPTAGGGGRTEGADGERNEPQDEDAPKPAASAQINLTDGDSALMCKNPRSGFHQCYNAQAAVDAEGSQLILSARVTNKPNDMQELAADVEAIDGRVGTPTHVLADSGYASEREVEKVASQGIEVLVAVESGDRRRCWDYRPRDATKPKRPVRAEWRLNMSEKLKQPKMRKMYRLRPQTVETVFGVMKHWMGCDRFLLRGKEGVEIEWKLMALAYNCKRLHNMMRA